MIRILLTLVLWSWQTAAAEAPPQPAGEDSAASEKGPGEAVPAEEEDPFAPASKRTAAPAAAKTRNSKAASVSASDAQEAEEAPPSQDAASGQEPAAETAQTGYEAIEDARVNFATVVETFIAKRSERGYWIFAQEKNGKALKLKLDSILEPTVHATGVGHYAGEVMLRELGSNRLIKADFQVDLASPQWQVEDISLRSEEKPDEAAAKPAAPKTAEKKKTKVEEPSAQPAAKPAGPGADSPKKT
ncbi:MAG TPA: hypothetical protein DEB40_10675 [Elusimicrobia bacterium]|nr:hypothetical protein [Elusimicrobiota bacterium]HBT62194.1 hypothetical protein [Elusimicrobiota bacterium]